MTSQRINSRTKGLTAERAVAAYFVTHGRPDAKRSVATGWSNGSTESGDIGDIIGAPPFAIQVKNLARRLEGKLLADTWRETQGQAVAMGIQLRTGYVVHPLLIEKRAGTSDVGRWWLHLDLGTLVRAVTGRVTWVGDAGRLVRVELGTVINDLVAWSREFDQRG